MVELSRRTNVAPISETTAAEVHFAKPASPVGWRRPNWSSAGISGGKQADRIDDYVDLEELNLFGENSAEEALDGDGEADESDGPAESVIDAAADAIEDNEELAGDTYDDGVPDKDTSVAEQLHRELSDLVDKVEEQATDASTRDTDDEESEEADEDGESAEQSANQTADRVDMRVLPRHSTMPE